MKTLFTNDLKEYTFNVIDYLYEYQSKCDTESLNALIDYLPSELLKQYVIKLDNPELYQEEYHFNIGKFSFDIIKNIELLETTQPDLYEYIEDQLWDTLGIDCIEDYVTYFDYDTDTNEFLTDHTLELLEKVYNN